MGHGKHDDLRDGKASVFSTMRTDQGIVPLISVIVFFIALALHIPCSGFESTDNAALHVDLVRLLVNALAITLIVVVVVFIYALRDKDE